MIKIFKRKYYYQVGKTNGHRFYYTPLNAESEKTAYLNALRLCLMLTEQGFT